ncbi:MAG: pyridoxal phosphate-dependent aminotransferase [Oscillibacter sp.]|nr:pyridoxal phosphate-dependent aminotransferase [Oscillibacter sp.]
MKKEMLVSELVKNYPASGIRKMFNIAAEYDNLVNLTLGEPNFDTPDYIKEAAKKALDEGWTHYSVNVGLPVLREAIAERYRRTHWDGYGKDNVIVTVGALEALTLSLYALVNPGDEVIIPDPCFPNYYGQILLAGAKAVPVPVYEENDYRLQAADVAKAITSKTHGIILNSPSNPLGSVMTREDIEGIAKLALEHNLYVFSDEPYDQLVYDGGRPFSIAEIPEVRRQVVVLNTFSKSYAMTGWRVGYLLADASLVPDMAKIQEGIVSCVPAFSQIAAAEALKSTECVEQMLVEYTRRRDILIDGINAIPGFSCKKSPGTFYAFVNIKAFGKSSEAFAEELIRNAGVVTVPGSAFGKMGEGYLRLVFANSDENLTEAVKRIGDYVRKAYPDLK